LINAHSHEKVFHDMNKTIINCLGVNYVVMVE